MLANPANPLNQINWIRHADLAKNWEKKSSRRGEQAQQMSKVRLQKIKKLRPDAALLASDTMLLSKRKEIADFMAEQRIPAIYPFREYAPVGGLFIYGANISVLFERAADYLDRLLKGEKVGNLPVQQATAFELNREHKNCLGNRAKRPP